MSAPYTSTRSTRGYLRGLAIIGAIAATAAVGALVSWATVASEREVTALAATGVQTAGHLRALHALGQIDTRTDLLEQGIEGRTFAELDLARRVLTESVDQMHQGTLAEQRTLARFAGLRLAGLNREIDGYLAALRSGVRSRMDAGEQRMETALEELQIRFSAFSTDPGIRLRAQAAQASRNANTIRRNVLVLIACALGFILLCSWQLRAYRRRTEAALREAQRFSERDARTDELTGLPNRRSLVEELDARVARGESLVLAFADLNGFKHYNDTFGHHAGDSLLRRLGEKLADTFGGDAMAARLGGDEFCVLTGPGISSEAITTLIHGALREDGDGFLITCEVGVARVPEEIADVTGAMRLADTRMYAGKSTSPTGVEPGVVDLLLRMLDERHPGLGSHVDNVAELATACAEKLELPADLVFDVRSAAQLHDIGKVAIPTSIIAKPGKLDDAEWAYIRQHTIIGERVLSVHPTMRRVGSIVRASHERWDGSGYPDRLLGGEIPIGGRIVAVADAFCAMTEDRTYCSPRSLEDALEELSRCAGSQFDPEVVSAFLAVVGGETGEGPLEPTTPPRMTEGLVALVAAEGREPLVTMRGVR